MKDKLEKNHHKGIYYKTKKFFLTSALTASLFTVIFVPTYIAIRNSENQKMQKAEEEVETVQTPSEAEGLLSF